MRTIISILLFVLVAFRIFGLCPLYELLQAHAKNVVEAHVKDHTLNELVAFCDPQINTAITWADGGNEFYYQGNKYDVVKKTISNGRTVYYCFSDQQETRIELLAQKQLNDDNTHAGHVALNLLKLLVQAYVPCAQYCFPADKIQSDPGLFYSCKAVACPNWVSGSVAPPPKLI